MVWFKVCFSHLYISLDIGVYAISIQLDMEDIILERIRQGQSQINKRMTSNLECDSAEFSLILYKLPTTKIRK